MLCRFAIAGFAGLILIARGSPAQILDVSAGTSTAYDSTGANLRWRSHGLDANFGFGIIDGSFALGGAMVHATANGSITVGEQDIATDLPTDVFENHHTLLGTGIGIRRNSAAGSFVGFSGWTTRGLGTPLFSATALDQTTHFVQWKTRLTPACRNTMTGAAGHAALGIASFDCKQKHSVYAASVGGTYGGLYAAASYAYDGRKLGLKASYVLAGPHFQRNFSAREPVPEPVKENVSFIYKPTHHWAVQASHGHYITQAIEDSAIPAGGTNAYRSGLDSVGVQYEQHNLVGGVNLMRSTYKTDTTGTQVDVFQGTTNALSATVRYTLGRVNLSEMLMESNGNETKTEILVSSADVAVNSRLHLSEGVNLTKDGLSFSHGGSLLTRYSSFEVDYQFFYVANQPSQPFQQALLFRADVQMPGVDFQASSSISPTGKPQYTFQLARSFSHTSAEHVPVLKIGKHVVRGRVEDVNGAGIGRAALLIDKDRVYTDAEGYFFYREGKRKTHYLEVLTTEFVSADGYDIREAPLRVTSSTSASHLVRIVVEKRKRPS